jgi:hypothetical protein
MERGQRQRGAEHARSNGMPLGLVGVEQALGRCPVNDLGELPSQIHGVLDAGVESLSADGRMHVRRVARQQHPSIAVGRRLPRGIAESRQPRRAMSAEVRPVRGDERLADLGQRRLAVADVRFFEHDAHELWVLHLAQRMGALLATAGMSGSADGTGAAARFTFPTPWRAIDLVDTASSASTGCGQERPR